MLLETGIWIWTPVHPLSLHIPVRLDCVNGFIVLYSFSSQREMCLAAVAQERILEFLLSSTDVPWDAGEDSKEEARV